MRVTKAALLVLAVLALCAGTAVAKGTAAKHGPRLDKSFGKGGGFTVSTPKDEERAVQSPVRLAVAPSNKSYAQQGSWLVAFGANGKPDPRFGNHGRVVITSRAGAVTEVAGVAVDSHGRILVAGSVEPVHGLRLNVVSGSRGVEFPPGRSVTEVFVERYLPDGTLDPSFGGSGEIDTTLSSPRPIGTVRSPAEYERASVRALHLSVDPKNRPVLAATYVERVETCLYKTEVDQAIVARLNEDGSLDSSFGSGGVEKVDSETPIALAPVPYGGWATLSGPEVCEHGVNGSPAQLTVLTDTGAAAALDPARPRVPAGEELLAVDGQGRSLYTERTEVESPPRIHRLLSNGTADAAYGHEGEVDLSGLGAKSIGALALDAKGRILAGFGSERLEITRISSMGKVEGRFGSHGVLRAKLAAPTRAEAIAFDSKGRILVAGLASDGSLKTTNGIGIARFLPGG